MHAKKWLTLIEIKTDTRVDYKQSQEVYERVQLKSGNPEEELQILRDSHRTYPDEPFFSNKNNEGQQTLVRLLFTLSKHSSSAGYTQGMN